MAIKKWSNNFIMQQQIIINQTNNAVSYHKGVTA